MVRLSLIYGGLLCAEVAAVLLRPATPDMTDAQKRTAYRPYVAASIDCLARAVLETPAALQHAREGAWMEAVRLTGRHCDPVAGRMIFAHDALYGAQTGRAFWREASAADLPKALAGRLRPAFEPSVVEAGQQAPTQIARAEPSSR